MSAAFDAALLPRLREAIARTETRPRRGRLRRVLGPVLEADLGGVRVGELCRVQEPGGPAIAAEVVGVTATGAVLAPIGTVEGLSARALVVPSGRPLSVPGGAALLGRVLDGLGRPLDGKPLAPGTPRVPVTGAAPPPLTRTPLAAALPLGLRVLDGLLTCAEGQRVGIFGPAGAGKSSLVARILRGASADAFVVALVGERGREVREFIERGLDDPARARTVVVVATSDRPALERMKAAEVATAIAETLRDEGRRTVLLVDSVTRLARAWREIGLAAGEPAVRRGFPPSVFARLPALLERAGPAAKGSITAFYTVLLEGEMEADPVAEEVKSVLDGHVVLCPKLAATDHHPAVDVLASRSRVMEAVTTPAHREAASRFRRLLARHAEVELLVRVGEYREGSDKLADEAIRRRGAMEEFLRQPDAAPVPFPATVQKLTAVLA